MAENPFLKEAGTGRSLNRARIETLPSAAAAEGVLGKRGYDLLSAAALRTLALSAPLPLDADDPALFYSLNRCFQDPQARPLALDVARVYGRRLGWLLLMLHWGEAPNRAARPDWTAAHWRFWREAQAVWMGGGLLAGHLGRHAVAAARELLQEQGACDLALYRAPHAAHLPLIGLSRALPAGAESMLVLDFGQSAVKRAVATFRDGALASLCLLPPLPTVCAAPWTPECQEEAARNTWQAMLAMLEQSWAAVPPERRPATAIGIALACYLTDGHPSPADNGCYACLQLLGFPLVSFMEQAISARLGQRIPLVLMHDGTAAATACAGGEAAVVLTLGTAIGNGFPPPAAGLRPLAARFRLTR